ncbi:Uncharacterised protein [Mycobacterium tuberculosis]|uniref:Uncharacterized protein n=1 Tax=Mycobacterium tuberculosis TaxID=1773 RepID=A0A0T7LYD2_MYCTX|nr:Uncharacterised protein [Mycobacterium tuberculosis]COW24519.1 Uncharacterised protein [Mycobacterium tuberculosis]COW82123.1 Uncharacterised protein [Mycobacterium tuberculosis]COZ46777.1 Uncharacterised protein [Mycobacterium tuberculosis]
MPGNSTTSETAWSANHGCTLGDNRPVNTTPPEAGRSTTAPSNGCSLAPNPKPDTSAPEPSAESQNRRLSKAYVGSST